MHKALQKKETFIDSKDIKYTIITKASKVSTIVVIEYRFPLELFLFSHFLCFLLYMRGGGKKTISSCFSGYALFIVVKCSLGSFFKCHKALGMRKKRAYQWHFLNKKDNYLHIVYNFKYFTGKTLISIHGIQANLRLLALKSELLFSNVEISVETS